jgi:flagellar hook-associated protein 2
MSSAGISFGGLASGLDTKSIIAALVAVERRPLQQLESKKTSLNRQKTLYGDLGGLLDKLASSAKKLKSTSDFLQMKGSSDNESVLTVSASSRATPGTHTVRVLDLATAQINASPGRTASSTANGSWGEFILTVGQNSIPVVLGTDTSLDGIAAAINNTAAGWSPGVRAEVVDTGNAGSSRFQLVVRSTETGAANGFSISDIDGDVDFASLMNGLVGNAVATAKDARALVNGLEVRRPTNAMAGAIAGVTLDLKTLSPAGTDVTVSITTDMAETAKKVQEFVDAYNKVVDFFTEQNALGADGKAKNPLFGDTTLRSLRSNLRSVVGDKVSTSGNLSYQLLSQLGITSDRQGKLTFAQSKMEEALGDDERAVAAVFNDTSNGIGKRLEDALKVYTDSVDGLLKTRTDGFDRLVRQTQSRIDQSEKRLELYKKQLETKYSNLETLLTRLQSQGSGINSIR